eukprot:TRINITY_DN7490_c0_g2_i2.p1 TRINITY_DN7490_c0_g2~~TRINITY_DN7490_c0_g2_i2.p1  ORF type:complete len:286 (+),score=36.67 TRINITY_DN7490_c0_g2_i2:486-1343(+)
MSRSGSNTGSCHRRGRRCKEHCHRPQVSLADVYSSKLRAVLLGRRGELVQHTSSTWCILSFVCSMGGAVAAHACQRQLIPNLSGLIVIDVVEGTAMSALSGMMRFLRSRPVTFETQEAGIKWALRNGQLRNCESARVSIPPQLMPATAKMVNDRTSRSISNALAEEDEDAESTKSQPTQSSSSSSAAAAAAADQGYTWRVDLSKSAPYWEEWFRGLSKTFLSVPGPKMLMLAGIDRLDKDLTIGQMQGQFQLQVIPNAGHCVHEDAPGQAGAAVAEFLKRYSLLV